MQLWVARHRPGDPRVGLICRYACPDDERLGGWIPACHPMLKEIVGHGGRSSHALEWRFNTPRGRQASTWSIPLGWLRAVVPGGHVKHPGKPYVRTLTSTPSPLST